MEGEDDAEALRAEGVVATTAPMGAGNVDKCDLSPLYGAAKVLVGVDKDPAGHKRAAVLRELLAGHVDQLEFRQAKSGKDIADHLAAGYTLDELEQLEQEDAPASDHEYRVQYELGRIRVREDARRRYEAEQRPLMPPFDAGTLAEMLDKPAEPPSRVEGLIPWEASTLITAQRKAGKTTLDLNLARSLLTGEDFLGRFGVRPLDGIVAMLKFEVSGAQLVRWADEAGIPRDRLFLVNLRGRRNPFTAEEDRQALAALLRGREVEAVLTDPFGRAYSGTSQNDPGEVGAWLADLDRWVRGSVGARDSVLTTHAGWNAERTRGSSALEDWADSIITLVRDDEEHGDGERYLRAIGRDVEVEEDRLIFEPETLCLRLAGAGSRKAAKGVRREEQLKAAILRIVEGQPWLNGSEIEHRLRAIGVKFQRGQERKALAALVKDGELRFELGKGNAKLYSPASASPTSPSLPVGDPWTLPNPPIGGRVQKGMSKGVEPPQPAGTSRSFLWWAGRDRLPAIDFFVCGGKQREAADDLPNHG